MCFTSSFTLFHRIGNGGNKTSTTIGIGNGNIEQKTVVDNPEIKSFHLLLVSKTFLLAENNEIVVRQVSQRGRFVSSGAIVTFIRLSRKSFSSFRCVSIINSLHHLGNTNRQQSLLQDSLSLCVCVCAIHGTISNFITLKRNKKEEKRKEIQNHKRKKKSAKEYENGGREMMSVILCVCV